MARSLTRRSAVLLAACGVWVSCARPRDPATLNVLVVTLDTTRADRIGAFGGTAVPTPRLDAAARQGTRFAQAVSTNPLTLPAHTSMFTGRYPFRHGVRHNGAYHVPATETTLAERLRDAGFRTAAFVGAFVLDPSFGLDQGFETYSSVVADTADADFLQPSRLERTADAVNASFFDWLDAHGDDRFFAWVHYYDPHAPYEPPERPGVRLEGSGYDREISFVDRAFGDLLGRLRDRRILDRTILVVLGDHGESLGSHGEKTHGIFLYEPAVRVPFFVRAPGLVDEDAVYKSPVSVADVAPTVLGLLRLPGPASSDGRALFGANGRLIAEDADRLVYAETWMTRIELGWSELSMLRGGRHKYVLAPRPELYDLEMDPAESSNRAEVDRAVAARFAAALTDLVGSGASAGGAPTRGLTEEELARLQSLGYLRGESVAPSGGDGANRPDPKDHIAEAVALETAADSLQRGDLADALKWFDEVLAENPRNHTALLKRSRTFLRQGNLESAEVAALAALEAAAEDPLAPGPVADNARALLATLRSLAGRFEEAEAVLREASNARDGGGAKRSRVAVLLAGAKNRDDAAAIVRLATERRPEDPWSWAAAVEFARKTSDAQAVRRAIERLERLGTAAGPALVDVGASEQRSGNFGLAIELFEAALRLSPDHPDLVGYLATAHLGARHLEEADRLFARVAKLRAADPRAPMYRATIALLQGDERRAHEMIAETLRRDGRFVPVLLYYARWLAENGRTQEAVGVVRDALARRPGDPEAAAMLRTLEGRSRSG